MIRKKRLAIVAGTLLAMGSAIFKIAVFSQATPPVPPVPASAKVDFVGAKAFLDSYCIACHAGAKPAGEIVLSFKDEAAAREKADVDPEFWSAVSRMVATREMPPEKAKKKPTDDE